MEGITNIVVSRWQRNVDYIYKLDKNVNIMIYDKENPENPYNVPINKGNEASVYLKHIVDHYDDNLSEFTFFIHDEEYSWHHIGSIIERYEEAVESKELYYNVNERCLWTWHNSISADEYRDLMKWYNEYVEEYIPISRVPNNTDLIYGYRGSAQFLVHRDVIRNLPKKFYSRLYEWIITTDLPSSMSGRYLEWTWHVFWYIFPKYVLA